MRRIPAVILFFVTACLIPSAANTAGNSLLLHGDMGTYNQQYNDRHYVDNNSVSFGMEQSTFGFEYRHTDPEKVSVGGGYALENVAAERQWNVDRWEVHPFTIIMVPYVFAGYGFNNIGLELGISCYLQFIRKEAALYYLEDGSVFTAEKEGISLERRHSHMFINANLRLFSEKSLHCKIRIGRENFDPLDSLINFALIYPFYKHRIEYYLSFLTLDNYLYTIFNQDKILRTNQTTGLCYSYDMGVISLGVRAGFLVYNGHGGDGIVHFTDRLNAGLFTVIKW